MSDAPRCPVAGCDARLKAGMLMCLQHWRRVPKRLQAEVWDTWKALRTARDLDAVAAYRHAAKAAVEAVDLKLKRELE